MAVTNYFTIDGEIIGEETGGTQTDYLTDALGSVTATVNQSAQVVNTYTYKPYGEQLAKTGAGADPKFGWVGSLGYRKTSRRFSEQYVRARHYGTLQGQWTTVDPLWPTEQQYLYTGSAPSCRVDASGRKPGFQDQCDKHRDKFPSSVKWKADCSSDRDCWFIAAAFHQICTRRSHADHDECVGRWCQNDTSNSNGPLRKCLDDICNGNKEIRINCPGRFSQGCCDADTCACTDSNFVIHLCDRPSWPNGRYCGSFTCVIAHELLHVCGFAHNSESGEAKTPKERDWVPASPYDDCMCSTCTELLPSCSNFAGYRYKGYRYKRKDCELLRAGIGGNCP